MHEAQCAGLHDSARVPDARRPSDVGGGTPQEFASFIAAENQRWAALVKKVNIRLD